MTPLQGALIELHYFGATSDFVDMDHHLFDVPWSAISASYWQRELMEKLKSLRDTALHAGLDFNRIFFTTTTRHQGSITIHFEDEHAAMLFRLASGEDMTLFAN